MADEDVGAKHVALSFVRPCKLVSYLWCPLCSIRSSSSTSMGKLTLTDNEEVYLTETSTEGELADLEKGYGN